MIITLLSDFGTCDGYVAAMKGVLSTLAPAATVVDASHDIASHNVMSGAWVLGQYWSRFPPGTIHVAVVDPGVGSSRLALAVEADGRYLLAPDNGLLAWVVESARVFRAGAIVDALLPPHPVSATFHGRDVFCRAAALLAAGSLSFSQLSKPSTQIVRPDWTRAAEEPDRIVGQIVHIDAFGNAITNIERAQIAGRSWKKTLVTAGRCSLGPLRRTYSDVLPGDALALIGSSDTLEIAVHLGRADDQFGLKQCDPVIIAPA
jgi:S-adenosyl-L-methionine hydrolase (adenosine-forming)